MSFARDDVAPLTVPRAQAANVLVPTPIAAISNRNVRRFSSLGLCCWSTIPPRWLPGLALIVGRELFCVLTFETHDADRLCDIRCRRGVRPRRFDHWRDLLANRRWRPRRSDALNEYGIRERSLRRLPRLRRVDEVVQLRRSTTVAHVATPP